MNRSGKRRLTIDLLTSQGFWTIVTNIVGIGVATGLLLTNTFITLASLAVLSLMWAVNLACNVWSWIAEEPSVIIASSIGSLVIFGITIAVFASKLGIL